MMKQWSQSYYFVQMGVETSTIGAKYVLYTAWNYGVHSLISDG